MSGAGSGPRLRGRDDELRVLYAALDRAVGGAMATVVVEGEAGIGKTALLAAVLGEARDRGVGVWSGHAQELERARPFGPWSDALQCAPTSDDPARARIGRLLAPPARFGTGLTVTSDPGLRFQVVDAFVDLVEDLAHERPVAIGLDDLQWADPSSLLTLTSLVRRLAHAPVLVVATSRPPPPDGDPARVMATVDRAGARIVHLGPLAEEPVAALVADVLGAEPGPGLLGRVRSAGGNPLYVTELLSALRREGGLRTAEGASELAIGSRPPSLALMIVRHLSFLSEPALDVLRPASVLGSSFAVSQLATVTGRAVGDLAPGLSEAVSGGVLGEDGDRLRFRHDLIRDAIYDDLPRSVRQAWHQEAGRRLAAAGASALTVAEHLLRGPAVDDAALRWVREAARGIAPGSPATAAALLGRGASALEHGDPRRTDLQAEQAGDLLWAGRIRDAESLFRELLERGIPREIDGALRRGLARALLVEGRVAEGLAEFARIEDALPAASDDAEVRAWLSMARATVGDLDGAAATATTLLSSPTAAEDDFAAAMALGALALTAEMRGALHDALDLIDRAVLRAGTADSTRRYPAQVTRAHILIELDRVEEARVAVTRQIGDEAAAGSDPRDAGGHPAWHAARIVAGVGQFVVGDWDEAVTTLETALALIEDTGQASSAIFGRSVLALMALHRGERDVATRLAHRAAEQAQSDGPCFRSEWAAWARARVVEVGGRPEQALTVLAESWDRCARQGARVEFPALGPDVLRLALAAGDRARAGDVADALDDLAATHAVPSFTAAALRCRGRHDDDPEPLLAAAEAYAHAGRPLALALTAEDAAEVLTHRGADAEARAQLERAVTVLEQLDAAHDVARVEARLRSLGVHRGRRGSRARPRTGWASLTPTEQRVVALVADGLSNPQVGERLYLSRRTVQTHLTHVFAKLDITSRAQLAAEAARRARP